MTSPRRPCPRTGSAGVTLIELMIVLVVIAVGILALSGVQTRSSTDVYATGRRTRALAVAQTQLEVSRGLGYAGAQGTTTGTSDGFNWKTRVDTLSFELNRLTVTVSWTEKGTADSLRLMDLISAR
jgi:prepilin-type N-terminal cleavage/methylation domain-containing protein